MNDRSYVPTTFPHSLEEKARKRIIIEQTLPWLGTQDTWFVGEDLETPSD